MQFNLIYCNIILFELWEVPKDGFFPAKDWYGEAQYGFYDLTISKKEIFIESVNYDGISIWKDIFQVCQSFGTWIWSKNWETIALVCFAIDGMCDFWQAE